ncbi:MAG TPA: ATP-binding cassette domain-containing protein [Solirubrobacteraceae bacterium]|jgi:ABC-2 type transport system ATP-binding protein|nr:ATP-binding cassette domain-containing protein [Solirubrobacteraceae bacterium]
MEAAIEAKDLRKTYPAGVTALDGLSLSVGEGTIFALVGPNGAGKSTTVRVLSTLSRPDSGSARVAGIDVLGNPVGVRRAIGVVGQKHGSDGEATGRENLVLQGEFYGITGRDLRRRVAQSLERFGLGEAADRKVKTYSGGMQRRLDIGMGLLHRPRVLFLDEPTTGLDPEARVELWREIERLRSDEAMTILLSTHYMDEADRLASRLAIIDRGSVVVEGTPAGLKGDLEGDTIHVELAEPDDGVGRAALDRVGEIGEVSVDGRTLHARARDGGAAVPAVLAALEAHGVRAASVTMARPSLEEVYLRHAGRAFAGGGGPSPTREVGSADREEVAA